MELMHCAVASPLSASPAPTTNNDVTELEEDMKSWKQRVDIVKNKKNIEDKETTLLLSDVDSLVRRPPSYQRTKLIDLLLECDFVELLQEMWRQCLRPELLEQKKDLPDQLHASLQLMWTMSDRSSEVCEHIVKVGLHADMLKILSWKALSAATLNDCQSSAHRALVEALNGTLHNVVRIAQTARAAFRKCHAVDIVQKFRTVTEYPMIAGVALMIQSYLVTEDDNKRLNSNKQVFEWLVTVLDCALSDTGWCRYQFAVIEVVEAINNLAVTDENKWKIVEAGALPHYVTLLSPQRSESEQTEAARGLWLLAFTCKENIIKQPGCLDALIHLERTTSSDEVRQTVAGALWILENRGQRQNRPTTSVPAANTEKDEAHVMISYNWGSQQTVLQLRDQLKSAGFKIWIDVENMSDSLLESMASAVEQAAVVLLCFTEKYKDSPNCRTEAEYAYNTKKKVVALRLEAEYWPDGWLGPLCINNLFYDFSNPQKFNDEWSKLHEKLKELELSVDGEDKDTTAVTIVTTPTSRDSALNISSWKTSDVHKWLNKNNLRHLQTWFEEFDGPMLDEFVCMQRQVPEAFYNALLRDNISMADILRINLAIKQL